MTIFSQFVTACYLFIFARFNFSGGNKDLVWIISSEFFQKALESQKSKCGEVAA